MNTYKIIGGSGVWHIVMSLIHGAYKGGHCDWMTGDAARPRYTFPLNLTLQQTHTQMIGTCTALVRSCKWSKKPNEFCELAGIMSWGVPKINEPDVPEDFTARFDLRKRRGLLSTETKEPDWELTPSLTFASYPETFDFAASLFGAFAQTGNLEEGLCERLPLPFGNNKRMTHVAEITEMRRLNVRATAPWGFAGRITPGPKLHELHENGTVLFRGMYDAFKKHVAVELEPQNRC
ncbi:MAG: hypothetical protein AAB927_03455 [Patescibacteria group bacterium]